MAIRILIMEGHSSVRRAIRTALRSVRDFRVVGDVATGEQALQLLAKTEADIVLANVVHHGVLDVKCLLHFRDLFPSVKVIALSLEAKAPDALRALRAGIAGYLVNNVTEELEPAIQAVAAGGTFFSRAIVEELTVNHRPMISTPTALSPRQLEVVKLIARGYSTKEIAARLRISVKTVQTHRTELMQRLDLHDVAGLVRYAIRHGLIRAD